MRQIKFRAWDTNDNTMYNDPFNGKIGDINNIFSDTGNWEFMQYTGLKDKNRATDVYEGDIIDGSGLVLGNIYEMDKRETDFVIQGFGTKAWCETYRRAVLLGCKDAE